MVDVTGFGSLSIQIDRMRDTRRAPRADNRGLPCFEIDIDNVPIVGLASLHGFAECRHSHEVTITAYSAKHLFVVAEKLPISFCWNSENFGHLCCLRYAKLCFQPSGWNMNRAPKTEMGHLSRFYGVVGCGLAGP
jgi:hypothetical protein